MTSLTYLLRMILHDWSDREARSIISNILPAMQTGARLVAMDSVLPLPGAVESTQESLLHVRDLTMMMAFNRKERAAEDRASLLQRPTRFFEDSLHVLALAAFHLSSFQADADDDDDDETTDNSHLLQTTSTYAAMMFILQELARILDRPFFPWKKIIVGFSLGQYLLEGFLSLRQYKVLQATKVPKVLEGEVSQEVFDKSQAYGRAKAKFGFVSGLYSQIQNLAFIYGDVLPKIWGATGLLLAKYAPEGFRGEITHTLLFVFVFNIITTILSLPTSYYSTFVLEEKFGFNKQTVKLWVMDMLKGQMLTVILGTPIISAILKIVQTTGNSFFYYLWMFGIFVQLFAITIYPIAILPLFNKLSPLEPGVLKTSVENLAKQLKFPLSELNVIDGSKRSAHSNAYFFGLPWKKHIVIYDTLIEKSETEEVVAVLSHELGHWSLSHTTKLFGIGQFHMFYIFALFSAFVNNKSLYQDFGFYNEMPIMIGFILFSDALAPTDAIIKLLMNILSRKFEFEAARSLLKLQIQNLSTMDADWMYASYHYSHPILSERLAALGWKGGKITGGEKEPIESDKPVKAADREL
ncbi:uncharacterized protein ARB_01060 [Trichophyton benhamiae CBS 112371]|uniref:Ste24 endopeptidase n=1 Tax=Arthroderma benhamiae (strain ATCC MYA-4681 / CBS 112371) TaxID=663331 RepID=D4AXZ1_ARTBC|nr:uncharacterized protein ARB_01060 [Trichophyton benhamiae CBS 112371]EFE32169.1 hypothetical protein ARB_01060 [Trichophyton benhamiae CBS 112371]